MNVLSLFDGMSCGRIALERAGITVESYYASEIDKHAAKVSEANYPDIKRLGDVQHINYQILPEIDLLIPGSPCQGFSFAGKQLNFSDSRSALFFEFIHALRTIKPKYFMLENVVMKKEYQDAISELVGYEPIKINSALVSAQNRNRLYWTNIPDVTQPKDKGIILGDIIEYGKVDRSKSHCLDANYYKGGNPKQYFNKHRRQLVFENKFNDKSQTLKRAIKNLKALNEKAGCLTAHGRGWACNGMTNIIENYNFRKLTVTECERLQTVGDGYTKNKGVSNTQRYKMLGNGWTIDVIAHIFKGLKNGLA